MEFLDKFIGGFSTTTQLLIGAGWSILFVPLTFAIFLALHNKLVVKKHNMNLRAKDEPMASKWSKMQPKIQFAMKDKRAVITKKDEQVDVDEEPKKPLITRQIFLYILFGLGFISTPALFMAGMYSYGLIVGLVLFYVALTYALNSPTKMMAQHEQFYNKMYKLVNSRLGVEEEWRDQPQKAIQVTKWGADFITPLRIKIRVPTTFDQSGEKSFLELFNQVYGQTRAWVARKDDGSPGWDYEEGWVYMYAVPPLPQIAPFHERYVLSDGIAWSFFGVGLGSENGVKLLNEETGKYEHVLGFDVAGEQKDVGKEAGLEVGPEITTSPMILCAGGTGGGKSVALTEKVVILEREN